MALPEWSRGAPGPAFDHGDNYSALEVVWTEAGTGLVVIETPGRGYLHLDGTGVPRPSALPTVEWGVAEEMGSRDAQIDQLRRGPLTSEQLRELAPPQPRWTRVEVGIASALGGGLTVGFLVHFWPWH